MELFEELLSIADCLLGPKGCPWDKEQTFHSLQPYLMEEAHEVLEAIDANVKEKIVEELGDLLYVIIFYAKIGEKEGGFSIKDILERICKKLIYRHPHIFGEESAETPEEVVALYEKVKKIEKAHENRESILDGIPPTLPLLVKAQKILSRIAKAEGKKEKEKLEEKQIAEELIALIKKANAADLDLESTLRRALSNLELAFKKKERRKEE